jgi:hypothetical protein
MDKQEARQAEMDTRHQETITWRNTVRGEDTSWRQTTRDEDKAWRETLREEDKVWRQSLRDEDKAWRESMRDDDKAWRMRSERTAIRCCSLTAAAQSAQPGTSAEEIFSRARKFEDWLNSQKD